MIKMTTIRISIYRLLFCLISFFAMPTTSTLAADFYWVGGSGNWSDLTRWASSSGGAGSAYLTLPSIGDNVFFDFNSFPSPASTTVTIDMNAECNNMSWTGVTNTPTLTGTNAFTLTIFGNLNFVTAMNYTFAGKTIFSAISTGRTITSAGKVFPNVEFTVSTLNSGYILQDNFTVTGTIDLLEGTLNTNSVTITCGNFTAANSPKVRTFNINNSALNITGAGLPLNFRGDDASFTLTSNANTLITLSNAGAITINTGLAAKTIPSMVVTNSTNVILNGGSGGTAGAITFGDITINQAGATLTTLGDCVKNYGNISMGNGVTATFNGNNTVNNSFNGTVTLGNNATVTFNNNNTFNQSVTIGNNTPLLSFSGANTFNSTLSVGTSSNVAFSGGSNTFGGLLSIDAFSDVTFSNTGINNFNNANLGQGLVWKFSILATNNINGVFNTIAANCNNVIVMTSNLTGWQTTVAVANTQTWSFVSSRDINKTGAGTLTIANGANAGNNANIIFTTASRTLYWVGNSGNWNDSNKWSLTSNGVTGQCPPTSIDDVVFDASSFTIGGQTVSMNIDAFCRNMTWATVANNPKMAGANSLTISGSVTLSSNMIQTGTATDFSGDVFFSSAATGNTITMAGKAFNNARFEGFGGAWLLNDAATVLNNLDVFAGALDLNNQILNTGRLSTAAPVDITRSINFTASTVNINGNGTALNLSGNLITSNPGTATINFNNNGAIIVETGATTKTLPRFIFTNTDPTVRTVTINTPSNASVITFRDIEVRKQTFVINGNCPKIYNGTLDFFVGVSVTINGSGVPAENIFNQTLTFRGINTTNFTCGATFNQNVTFFDGINLGSIVTFVGSIIFPNAGTLLDFRNNVNVNFTGNNRFRDVITGDNCFLILDNNDSEFDNLTLKRYTSVRFAQSKTTKFNQVFSASVNCDTWISIGSSVNGVAANLDFLANQTWQSVIVKDINNINAGINVTANNSSSGGNNTNINFVFLNAPRTLYWIGGSLGDWSDGSKWSFTSGGAPANCVPTPNDDVVFDNNSFPMSGGTVSMNLFLMFCRSMTWSNTNNTGTMIGTNNILQVYGNLTFNGIRTVNTFSGDIELRGNSTPATKNVTCNGTPFFGNVILSNNDTWVLQDALDINNASSLIFNYGKLDMNGRNVNVEGNLYVNTPAAGSGLPQSTFVSGTNTVTFDGKNNTQAIRIPDLAIASCIECDCSTSSFYNVVIDKFTTPAGRQFNLETGISIKNDFSILNGDFWDNGFQIRGNTTGTFTMANNTALRLGSTMVSTVFPTCFPNINISAGTTAGLVNDDLNIVNPSASNPAIVEYRSSRNQLVKHTTYGTLLMTRPTGGNIRSRMLEGPITVNGSLIVRGGIILKDMGFQITGNANPGNKIWIEGILTLGTASPAASAINSLEITPTAADYTELTTDELTPPSPLPVGIPLPAAVSTNALTTFPTFTPVGDFTLGTGKMQMTGSVSYNSGSVLQNVLVGFTYTHLYAYGTPFVSIKELVGTAGSQLKVTGNLLVNSDITFRDKGFQIDATGNLFLRSGSFLSIGEGNKATKWPPNLPLTNLELAVGNVVLYNADVPQEISTRPIYQGLWLAAPGVTSGNPVPKTMVPTAPVKLGSYSVIGSFNNLIDNGSQIYSDPAAPFTKQFVIEANSALTLGNVAIATRLPTNFDEYFFHMNSTVAYNSNQLQVIDPFNGFFNMGLGYVQNGFANLTISTNVPTPAGVKEMIGQIRVNNNLLIRSNNTLNDRGFQINGNNLGGVMTMENQSTLILGSASTATGYPSGYPRPNNNLNPGSTVIYTANPDQAVTTRPIYGSLIFRKITPSAPFSVKSLFFPNGDQLRITGDFTIESFNEYRDNGVSTTWQGTGSRTFLMQNNSLMTLGGNSVSTLFPNQFTTIDLSPNATPSSTVVFNSTAAGNNIVGQNTANVPFSYGNLTLNSGGSAVTKNLLSNINVRRNLTINASNNLDATTSNFNINLGGNWTNTGGTFTARNGKVTLDGTTTQNLSTNTSDFFNLEINNAQGATMLTNIGVGGAATFTNGIYTPSTNQLFIFRNNATVAPTPGTFPGAPGPSNNSFVNGTVRKIGSQAFMFPVGKVIDPTTRWYAPIGISAPANATTQFTATYVPQDPQPLYNRTITDGTISRISAMEYWLLDRAVNNDNVRVTLSWDTPRSGGVFAPGALLVAHWRSVAPIWWANGGNSATTGSLVQGTVTSSVVFDNFSPFTLGSTIPNNPLPVELINFTATPNYLAKNVTLNWQTASETNNEFFTVEKSRNGKDFRPFAQVPSLAKNGNSQEVLKYQEIDHEPFSGLSYYRLKQTDFGGKERYSKIVAVRFENITEEDRFVVYPNPTEGTMLNIQFLDITMQNAEIVIYDVVGKNIYQQKLNHQTTDTDLIQVRFQEKLAVGNYIIKIIANDKVYLKKFSVL